jgi:uncharacterized repeat protein (TIGR01451 family)
MSETRSTNRLTALIVVAILISAIGVFTGNRAVLVAAIAPVSYLLYGQLTALPELDLAVSRTLDESNPAPGSEVAVTLTVTNEGSSTIPKLQIVDGVPAELGVASGSPRRATALRPGESTTVTYSVIAKRGIYEFGDTYLNGQGFSSTDHREQGQSATGTTEITCDAAVHDPLERELTHKHTGQVPTDDGGTGTEFYAIREHQHSDPVNRIDWNRYAREGELTTVEFRERKGAPVVVLVDLRSAVDVARRQIDPPATELSVYAARRLLDPLFTYGTEAGVAFYTGSRIELLPPARGSDHKARTTLAFREAVAGDWSSNTTTLTHRYSPTSMAGRSRTRGQRTVADGDGSVQRSLESLEGRLPGRTNIILFSPFIDSFPGDVATYLQSFGHAVTVLSPDVTTRESAGGQLESLDRDVRITKLRRTGVGVISWDPDQPLAAAITRTLEGQL